MPLKPATLGLGLLLLWLAAVVSADVETSTVDVCILGGGSAGMNMAWNLKDRGYSVKVFEKSYRVGGHCNTLQFPDPEGNPAYFDIGVIVMPNTTLANQLGYGPWSIDMVSIVERFAGSDAVAINSVAQNLKNYEASFITGQNYGPPIASATIPGFLLASARLVQMMNTTYNWTDTFVNMPSPLPAELTLPFSDWITLNGFEVLGRLFNASTFYAGMGNFSEITALDAILNGLARTAMLSYSRAGAWFRLKRGCQSIYDGIIDYIGTEAIVLNFHLDRVERPLEGPVVIRGTIAGAHHNHHEQVVQRCGKVVVAFPPTLENLAPFALSPSEFQLFSKVKVSLWLVSSAEVSGNFANCSLRIQNSNASNLYYQPQLPAAVFVDRSLPYGPASVGGLSTTPNLPELEAVVERQIRGVPAAFLTDITITEKFPHIYNPRFPPAVQSEAIPPALQIDALQGHRNTYWVGAVRSTPSTVNIWNLNNLLVEQHFPHK